MVSDEKNLDPKKPRDKRKSIGLEEPEQHPLKRARDTLYQHINNTSIPERPFFTQHDRSHKRELVAIMRRIDNQQISSVHELLALMQHMASIHQSETFNTLLHSIKNIIESHLDAEVSGIRPPVG